MVGNTISKGPYLSLVFDPAVLTHMRSEDFKSSQAFGLPIPALEISSNNQFFSKFGRIETITSVTHSLSSLSNATIEKWILPEPEKRSVSARLFAEIPLKLIPAIASSYSIHEIAGHGYLAANPGASISDEKVADLLSNSAGLNTTMRASESLPWSPYEGVLSDLEAISLKLDLPFYMAISESVVRTFHLDAQEGDPKNRDKGDVKQYLMFQKELTGADETLPLALLALWQTAGTILPWPGPAVRVMQYALTGKQPENPYAPGKWSLTTTGAMAPTGPLYGIGARYFIEGNTAFPSGFSSEVWSSFIRAKKGSYPFGYQISLQRWPLPFQAGALRFAISAHFIFSEQDLSDLNPRNHFELLDPITMAGGAALYLQGKNAQISMGARCKETGFLPAELFEENCLVLLGTDTSF